MYFEKVFRKLNSSSPVNSMYKKPLWIPEVPGYLTHQDAYLGRQFRDILPGLCYFKGISHLITKVHADV